jgi:putative membrane protein
MSYGMHDGGWGIWWMIVSWVVVVAIVVLIVRALTPSGGSDGRAPDARRILEERFARGEISEQEYRERKRVLDESRR